MANWATETHAKQVEREKVWALLEREGAVSAGVYGRIPDFVGAEQAADRLAREQMWQCAETIKAVPDKPQYPVRVRALHDGKLVYMAVPRLAARHPFYLLDPSALTAAPEVVASSKTVSSFAPTISLDEMRPVDLVVCGSVAVDRRGCRIGKGAGYSDIELALLQEQGLIGTSTNIVTTVHSLQVVEHRLPETTHDFHVDFIVTPDELIQCSESRRPQGIVWDHLTSEKIEQIPVLKQRKSR